MEVQDLRCLDNKKSKLEVEMQQKGQDQVLLPRFILFDLLETEECNDSPSLFSVSHTHRWTSSS